MFFDLSRLKIIFVTVIPAGSRKAAGRAQISRARFEADIVSR